MSTPPRRISRLLVANRGEVASRVFATARAMGLGTVAVYSDPDAALPYVAEADLAVPLPGSSPAQTYLDVAKLLEAASRAGADAVHPGYGFLAEDAAFAQAVLDAGMVWVGPAPLTLAQMGSKTASKRAAVAAGVRVPAAAELVGDDTDQWLGAAATVGFPLLVKAVAGGGGRGIRLVEEPADLADAVRSARREAAAVFGDGTVFAERYLRGARHVEVQILGDTHGQVVHLFERECSVQRRHQKIIEESPSPGTAAGTLRQMYAQAVALARSVGYVGAGTVEFLVVGDGDRQEFFFLEMNPRLQVEHAVTEAITHRDLVRLQLLVAQGLPHGLAHGGYDRWDAGLLNGSGGGGQGADAAQEPGAAGPPGGAGGAGEELDDQDVVSHLEGLAAVEARLYAEDPAAGYLPSTGPVLLFEPAGDDDHVRWDATIRTGSTLYPYYDALVAKVVASGGTRAEAAGRLARALRATRIHGPATNRDQLVAVLESEPFLAGGTPTDFLDLFPELVTASVPGPVAAAHLVAAVLHRAYGAQIVAVGPAAGANGSPVAFAPPGWRNVPSGAEQVVFARADGSTVDVRYELGPGPAASVTVDGTVHRTWRYGCAGAQIDLMVDGLRTRYLVAVYPADGAGPDDGDALVCVDGAGWSTQHHELSRFGAPVGAGGSGDPTTAVPGTVTAVLVAPGDRVDAGQTLVVLEAMKMEHRVRATSGGIVAAVLVKAGDAVDAHAQVVAIRPGGDGERHRPTPADDATDRTDRTDGTDGTDGTDA